MDRLQHACRIALEYPKQATLLSEYQFQHHLIDHSEQLELRTKRMFEDDENQTALYFLDLLDQSQGE